MKQPIDSIPTFLRIQWEAEQEAEGRTAVREAFLCKFHRQEIARKFPNARGCGQQGYTCELCDERSRKAREPDPRRPGTRACGEVRRISLAQRASDSTVRAE